MFRNPENMNNSAKKDIPLITPVISAVKKTSKDEESQ